MAILICGICLPLACTPKVRPLPRLSSLRRRVSSALAAAVRLRPATLGLRPRLWGRRTFLQPT
eukprot:1079909-Prymnesium_polylepis.1